MSARASSRNARSSKVMGSDASPSPARPLADDGRLPATGDLLDGRGPALGHEVVAAPTHPPLLVPPVPVRRQARRYFRRSLRSPFFCLVLPFLWSELPSLFSFLSPVRAPPPSFIRPLALPIAPSSLSLPPLPPKRPMRSPLSVRPVPTREA